MRPLTLLGTLLILVLGHAAQGQTTDPNSGNAFLPKCRAVIRGAQETELVHATYCIGTVSALVGVAPLLDPRYRFCFPANGNTEQAVRVVVAFLEKNPSILHEDFRSLAILAMLQAWPCR